MCILGIAMLLGAHAVTTNAFWTMADHTKTVHQVAQAFEANPSAVGLVTSIDGITLMISYVLFPAIILCGYYLHRKQIVKSSVITIAFYGSFVFFVGLLNFLNDLSALLGLFMNLGII
jgi:hypothetical protein